MSTSKKEETIIFYNPDGTPLKEIKIKPKIIPNTQPKIDDKELSESTDKFKLKIPRPLTLVKSLDRRVFGQSHAKQTLALAVQNIGYRSKFPEIELPKTNVLLFGPTGCGKTLLIDTIKRITNIPIATMKMTGVSPEGYYGPSIGEVFAQLDTQNEYANREMFDIMTEDEQDEFLERDFVPNADFAIIYLDEIDKIARNQDLNGGFGYALQDELIGYIEESLVLEGELSTKNMLFIGSGAFVGLEKIVAKRLNENVSVGFGAQVIKEKPRAELIRQVTPSDLIEYGFKPELVGRFSARNALDLLSEEDLMAIQDMKSSYLSKQRQILLKARKIKVSFPRESKRIIAKYAAGQGTNARGLQDAIDIVLRDIHLNGTRGSHITLTPQRVSDSLRVSY